MRNIFFINIINYRKELLYKDKAMTYIVKTVEREVNDSILLIILLVYGKMIYYQLDNDQNGINMSSQLISNSYILNCVKEATPLLQFKYKSRILTNKWFTCFCKRIP